MNIKAIITACAPYVGSLVRKGLVSGGSILAAKGVTDPSGDMEVISGAVFALGGAVWSLWNKWKNRKTEVANG